MGVTKQTGDDMNPVSPTTYYPTIIPVIRVYFGIHIYIYIM